MSLKTMFLLTMFLLTSCGAGDPPCPDDCETASATRALCRFDDCTPPETEPAVGSVSITIRNDSAMYRTFNAGWAVNPDLEPHATGWLLSGVTLAPSAVEFFPSAITATEGDVILIGVSGYFLDGPNAWARAEPSFTLPAGNTSCVFSYQYVNGAPVVATACPTAIP